MDEIDAIGGRRFSEGTSADREIQRTLMELLNQLDGFDQLGKVSNYSRNLQKIDLPAPIFGVKHDIINPVIEQKQGNALIVASI